MEDNKDSTSRWPWPSKTDLGDGVQVVLSCGQGDLDWGAGGREGQLVSPLPPPYSPLYLPAGGCLTSAQLQFIIIFVQLLFVAISTLLYSVIWMVDQKASWFSNIPNGCFPLNQRFDSQCNGYWTTEWIFEESGIDGEDLQEDYDDFEHGLLDSLSLGI